MQGSGIQFHPGCPQDSLHSSPSPPSTWERTVASNWKTLFSDAYQGPDWFWGSGALPPDETPPFSTLKPRCQRAYGTRTRQRGNVVWRAHASALTSTASSRSRTLERHYSYSPHHHWPNTGATMRLALPGFMLTLQAHLVTVSPLLSRASQCG